MEKPDIQLSAAEKRLLRKVFHRHALPYLAAMAVVTAVAVFGGEPKEAEVSAEAAVPPPELAALVQARIDADALVAELTATAAQQNAAAESAASELESLEKGIDTASRRLRDLESKARKAQKKLDEVASAPPPEAAQWDVSAILERLYNVEVRQDKVEADGGKLSANSGRGTRDILERLAHLARATGAVVPAASRSAPPAAPAPLANP